MERCIPPKMRQMTDDRPISMVKCILAYHWSFVLYDVIFIRHYKLLLKSHIGQCRDIMRPNLGEVEQGAVTVFYGTFRSPSRPFRPCSRFRRRRPGTWAHSLAAADR